MARSKTVYTCRECGTQYPKWQGKCTACTAWNTIEEEVISAVTQAATRIPTRTTNIPLTVSQISVGNDNRIRLGIGEMNRVLGGGLVPGSLVLIGGEPGIGKSTLALQIAFELPELKTLYISGEESPAQIKLRAERLKGKHDNCLILSETLLEQILLHIENEKPGLVVIDSVQTLYTELLESAPGSVSQIRECTHQILRLVKPLNIPVMLIGHINKEGALAGPKVLEHLVDTVLQFEGDNNHLYRLLRATKNRFGSTSEIGIFEMQHNGLQEVGNPVELLLTHRDQGLSGIAIAATMEGQRPLLIETQALVSSAVYGTPQRSATGFDLRRMSMLLAVLEKRAGFRLSSKDVFLNITGGLKVSDPAVDMAVALAVLSSDLDVALPMDTCFSAEIGLSGEIRPVNRMNQRIGEAEKLGFKEIFISKYTKDTGLKTKTIKVSRIARIQDAVRLLFG